MDLLMSSKGAKSAARRKHWMEEYGDSVEADV
jgi:hypothetical protein